MVAVVGRLRRASAQPAGGNYADPGGIGTSWRGCRMLVRRVGPQLAAVAGVLVAALALGACGSGPDRRFAADTVRPADVVERVTAPGAVQAAAQADLHAPVAAKVADLRVRDGQRAVRGQVLAQLSSTQIDDSIRQARAAVDSAAALDGAVPSAPTGAALAAIEQVQQQLSGSSTALLQALRSTLPLLPEPQRALVMARLDQAERQVAEAQQNAALRSAIAAATAAQRGQAQLALDLATEQKRQLTLRAPMTGTVQLGRATGASAGAGVSLPDLSSLPESAQQALQGLGGAGQSAGGPTYEVDLVLRGSLGSDSAPTPRVGMTATAEIQVRRAPDALSVPGSALVGRDGGQQAVLVIEGGKVHTRPVKVSV